MASALAIIISDLAKWTRSQWVLWWWTICSPVYRRRIGEDEFRLLEAFAMRDSEYVLGISSIDGPLMRARLIRARYIAVVPTHPAALAMKGTAEGMFEESFWAQNHPTEDGLKRVQQRLRERQSEAS